MLDIEVLGLIKIMFEVVEDQQVDRKFDSLTTEPTVTLNCRINSGDDSRSDGMGIINNNPSISYYCRSTAKGQTKKPAD